MEMEFFDIVNDKNDHLADVIVFDDFVCDLKFNTSEKVYSFNDFFKLLRYLETLYLPDGYNIYKKYN